MARLQSLHGIGLCVLTIFSGGAMALDAAGGNAKWGPHIDAEAKLGSKRNLGEVDLFLPIMQNARTLVFGNLRGRVDDDSGKEGNLGLGVRQMQESGWNLGAYGYLDRRRSSLGNYFNQATLGAEALGRDWDFRANAYVPLGDKAHDLGTGSVAAVSGTSVQVTTTRREERALKGFDGEVGWRTPLFDTEARRQLRLYVGGYQFSDAGITVDGPRVRAELTMEDLTWFGRGTKLFLGVEAQHDSLRGGQTFLSARLRIPLEKESERPSALSAQERRMTAPVMRDVDIVTQSRIASTQVETATAIATGGQAITVLNSATTTAATLQNALNAAGASTVILSGTFNTNAQVNVAAGQTVIGGGTLAVKTASGYTASLSLPSATINRNAAPAGSSVVSMGNGSSLVGITVTGTSAGGGGYAIAAQNSTGVTLRNNTLSSTFTSGYAIDLIGSINAVVTGNTILATASVGGGQAIRADSAANISIVGNTISATGTPAYVITGNQWTSFAAGSNGNVAVSGTCIFPFAPTGSVGFSTITCP